MESYVLHREHTEVIFHKDTHFPKTNNAQGSKENERIVMMSFRCCKISINLQGASWLPPDGYSRIFRSYVIGPSGF